MNDLKRFIVLQARISEFLAQLDEATLDAIVSGTARFAVRHDSNGIESIDIGSRPISVDQPSRDPFQAAQDLSRLSSEQERRTYLNAANLPLKGLRQVAKFHGLAGYSKLARPGLIDLLAGHSLKQADAHAGEARMPESAAPSLVDDDTGAEPLTSAPKEPQQRTTLGQSIETGKPADKAAVIAAQLREMETEEEGAAYLRAEHLDHESLLAVAAELQLTRVNRLSQAELQKRVLKQAIGARRKFAGLRKW